jgi:hypothetical protein
MRPRRILISILSLTLIAAALAVPGVQLAEAPTERLINGDFESGFVSTAAGRVGKGWQWFDNGGQATYGFYDETWAPVIYHGSHAQLIEINTYGRASSDLDRYAGIYQTVSVVPGQTYELSLHGMLRALEDDPDRSNFGYRVQYGVDYSGGNDWRAVNNWVELPWNTIDPRLSPGTMQSFSTDLTATTGRLTLFVRAWKKWGTTQRELDVDLDSISLKGAATATATAAGISLSVPSHVVIGQSYTVPVTYNSTTGVIRLELLDGSRLVGTAGYPTAQLNVSVNFAWVPQAAGTHILQVLAVTATGSSKQTTLTVTAGPAAQFLVNGNFEAGFHDIPPGQVGNGWGWFDNGGPAKYVFYNDTWPPVVHDGKHAQLIEIETFGFPNTEPDRYAGIYQTVSGLTAGATYQLSMYGMLRVQAGDPDQEGFNYRVQWGYDPSGGTDWRAVTNWAELPWDTVYTRLEPGQMSGFTTTFAAPSDKITIFIRAWKKWATVGRELDVDLDSITLTGFK